MTIETKFNVNDIVQSKFSRGLTTYRHTIAYEVLEIQTQTCYGGTQVFYLVRPIMIENGIDLGKKDTAKGDEYPRKTMSVEAMGCPIEKCPKFREDELMACAADVLAVVTANS